LKAADEVLDRAIALYLASLPPRYALSAVLRRVWTTPQFAALREELSRSAEPLGPRYSEAAKRVRLGEEYASVAKELEIGKKFKSAWRRR